MPATIESLGIDKLSIDEQESLMKSILKNIVRTAPEKSLSANHRADLLERIREAEEHPGDMVMWDAVRDLAYERMNLRNSFNT